MQVIWATTFSLYIFTCSSFCFACSLCRFGMQQSCHLVWQSKIQRKARRDVDSVLWKHKINKGLIIYMYVLSKVRIKIIFPFQHCNLIINNKWNNGHCFVLISLDYGNLEIKWWLVWQKKPSLFDST